MDFNELQHKNFFAVNYNDISMLNQVGTIYEEEKRRADNEAQSNKEKGVV